MSADKYAQFIAEQQRKLSVSGVNPVELTEKKHMSKADIAKLKEPKDEIDADDLEALRNKEHLKKEEVEQIDEISGKTLDSYSNKSHWASRAASHKAKAAAIEGDEDEEKKQRDIKKKRDTGYARALVRSHALGGNDPTKTVVSRYVKYAKKMPASYRKEETESEIELDEVRAIQGKHASVTHKAPSITPTRIKQKGKASKPKVQTDLNLMASYEPEGISLEEQTYIAEMVGKGMLQDILRHHKDAMLHHQKMAAHHSNMYDKSMDVGDTRGAAHHEEEGMMHSIEAERHGARYDHATGLKAHANAKRELKAAQNAVKAASDKIARAKIDKKEW